MVQVLQLRSLDSAICSCCASIVATSIGTFIILSTLGFGGSMLSFEWETLPSRLGGAETSLDGRLLGSQLSTQDIKPSVQLLDLR